MSLEDLTGAKYINALNSSNPASGDTRTDGDDHMRGIKNVLKVTFPNITAPVTLTAAEFNYNDISTLGTAEASKTVTADANVMVKSLLLDEATCHFADASSTGKDLRFELSSATADKTMIIRSSHTADRTITLPNASDTLVGKATTDTLSNKTMASGTVATTQSSGDNSTAIATTAYVDASGDVAVGTGTESINLTDYNGSNVAHGLGAAPSYIQAYLKCLSAEYNYSIGDRIEVAGTTFNGGALSIFSDATNIQINIETSTNVNVCDKNSSIIRVLTNTSWKCVIVPYLFS